MIRIECFFDCSSPWAYIGFSNLLALSGRLGIEVAWRPVVVGFVFAAANPDIYASRRLLAPPLRSANESREMQAWAEDAGLVVRVPPACGHPVNSIRCMRACIALQPLGKQAAFATAAFEALWRDGRNIGLDEVLADLARQVGVDPAMLFARIADDEPRHILKANTDELIRRGGFGVPTFFIDDEIMLFGNNRMRLVEHHLRTRLRLAPTDAGAALDPGGGSRP